MGSHYINKAILLDERDIEAEFGVSLDKMDELREFGFEHLRSVSGEWEFPSVDQIGLVSERFDKTCLLDPEDRQLWLREDRGWEASLHALLEDLGALDQETRARFRKTGDIDHLIGEVSWRACDAIRAESFSLAITYATTLENCRVAGLPCFRARSTFTSGGEEDGHDFRSRNYGPGRRIIAEIAFVWD